jgi:hypothetical protein
MPHRFSPLLALPLLVFALLLAGCDSGGGDDEPAINGTWQGISDNAVDFVRIDLPDFEVYEDTGDCYASDEGELEQVSGDTYSIVGQDENATFEVDDDVLTITEEEADGDEDITRYRSSGADVTTFTLCD